MNKPAGTYRYRILALLFAATSINYFDRSIMGVMSPDLKLWFGWTNKDYSHILVAFQIAYAVGLLSMGGIIDRLGTKKGYILSIGLWSFFGMMHAVVGRGFSLVGFSIARFGLGFGEAGNFPAAIKTTAEWFPKKERAFATGIFNAATSVGAIAAPFVVGGIVHWSGGKRGEGELLNWRIPFLITGALSAIWVFLWWKNYQKPSIHPKLSTEERTYINSDLEEKEVEKADSEISKPRMLEDLFSYKGRASRGIFWVASIILMSFSYTVIPLLVLMKRANWRAEDVFVYCKMILILIGLVGLLWASFATQVRRLHDIGFSGWFALLSLVPVINVFMFAVLGFKRGGNRSNLYGLPQSTLFDIRETWAFCFAKITDAVWWFYLFWGAIFLAEKFKVDIKGMGLPFLVIYLIADGGSIFGGWLSGKFIQKGWSINKARKMTLLICALVILPVCYVAITENKWLAIFLIGLGAAGHQAWSANIFTLVSDVFPKKATASVVGIGGMVGALAGMLSNIALGETLDKAGSTGFFWAFLIAGSLYLVTLLIVHLIMPKMTPLDDNLEPIRK